MAKRNSTDDFSNALITPEKRDDEHATSSTRSLALNGLRVLSLESRQATAMRNLLRNHGATATVVPAMREVPLENHPSFDEFVNELQAERIEISVWTTGVGVRLLAEQLDRKMPRETWTTLLAQRCSRNARLSRAALKLSQLCARCSLRPISSCRRRTPGDKPCNCSTRDAAKCRFRVAASCCKNLECPIEYSNAR